MSATGPTGGGLRRNDYLLLTLYCLLFFGLSLVGGRPLTMHEGVLPETAREMALDHDWIIPHNGGRPWVENPPLPQWITVGIGALCGTFESVAVARIGPALVATLAVLLVAWMSAGWFGRTVGLLSGFVFATTYEVTQYAWLAEDEIFLCTLTVIAAAAFARAEFFPGSATQSECVSFFGSRPASVLWFFIALGATNFAKGILFGAVMTAAPIGVYLLWNRDLSRIRYYCWFWGWLAFAVLAAAWPVAAWISDPGVVDVWMFDHVGRLKGSYDDASQPWYYYLKVLPGNLAPWTAIVPFAFWITRRQAIGAHRSPERYLWCWAIIAPALFSIPTGKHHHYLLHCMAPWSILAACALPQLHRQITSWPDRLRNPLNSLLTLALPGDIALVVLRHKIEGPPWLVPVLLVLWPIVAVGFSWAVAQRRGNIAAGGLIGAVTLGFCAGHLYAATYKDQCLDDTKFLLSVPGQIPADQPVLVNTQMSSLDEFRIQFYLGRRAWALHNLTFLADDRLPVDCYLIDRAARREALEKYGTLEIVSQSARARREKSPADRLTLFHLRLRDDLPRVSTSGLQISPMQAMNRAPGPFLGQSDSDVIRR